jgi:hypothetical protein
MSQEEARLSEAEWRSIWDDVLDKHTRRHIRTATRRGEALEDPDHAAIAIEFAHRRASRVRMMAGANTFVYAAFVTAMFLLRDGAVNSTYWLLLVVFATGAVGSAVIGYWLARRLQQAEERNRQVLVDASR